MNWRSIPPVRRLVPVSRGTEKEGWAAIRALFGQRPVSLYSSGTQALQSAILDCLAKNPRKYANVILPAYGCPDLVTACLGAGVAPRLVDISAEGWGYDLTALDAVIDENTIAVVAVNLLGVGDAIAELVRMARAKRLALIQDSAQCLPAESCDWLGDYAIFSFGKGKPLNLLGGGLAIGLETPKYQIHADSKHRLLGSVAAGLFFNAVTEPAAYAVLSKLPGIKIGQTVYSPPTPLVYPRSGLLRQLGAALNQYGLATGYSAEVYAPYLEAWSAVGVRVLQEHGSSSDGILPKHPLRLAMCAADAKQSQRIVSQLAAQHLGATSLYRVALNRVAGLPSEVAAQGPFPNANHLANCLFTLPTHGAITTQVAARINDNLLRATKAVL